VSSGISGKIAFDRSLQAEGYANVYVINADGSHQRRLTARRIVGGRGPAWSPDGRKIAFAGGRLYVVNANGSGTHPITPGSMTATEPSWSPDSTKVAFVRVHALRGQIYVANVDGTGLRRVTPRAIDAHSPTWSPDGRTIAFVRDLYAAAVIYLVHPDGRALHTFPGTSKSLCRRDMLMHPDCSTGDDEPAWSPRGDMLAFRSTPTGGAETFVSDIDARHLRRLTPGKLFPESASWSPDGTTIAFDGEASGDAEDIYTVSVHGTSTRQLTTDPHSDRFPAWSPDGSKIAFESDRDHPSLDPDYESFEIYVMNKDGGHQQRLTWHSFDAEDPAWQPPPRHGR
jgi:TolB protein